MANINDIQENLLWFPIDIKYSIIYILSFLIIYIIIKNILSKKTTEIKNKNEIINKKHIDFSFELWKIKSNFLNIDKDLFYLKISNLLREFLEEKYNIEITKMTLNEVKNQKLTKEEKELFEEIYLNEYKKDFIDNSDLRLNIIERIWKII